MNKIEEHAGIQIPIYYHEDEDGNKVYDYDMMREEFEDRLSELNCRIVDDANVDIETGKSVNPTMTIKHFADGFHEGRWEDDMVDKGYTREHVKLWKDSVKDKD